MVNQALASAHRKLARASQLIDEVDGLVSGYAGAFLVPERVTPALGGLVVRILEGLPLEIEEISGDAIHNLRSSLDHLAVGLVSLNGKSSKGVHFPFSENADQLNEMIKRKNFHRASMESQDLLRELQPYRGGNFALRALHDMDIMDKHHELIPIFHAGVMGHVEIGSMIFDQNRVHCIDGSVPIMAPWFAMNAKHPSPIPLRLDPSFDAGPYEDQSISETLHGLMDLCVGVLDAFEALYRW
jgi:hypothetical protein